MKTLLTILFFLPCLAWSQSITCSVAGCNDCKYSFSVPEGIRIPSGSFDPFSTPGVWGSWDGLDRPASIRPIEMRVESHKQELFKGVRLNYKVYYSPIQTLP